MVLLNKLIDSSISEYIEPFWNQQMEKSLNFHLYYTKLNWTRIPAILFFFVVLAIFASVTFNFDWSQNIPIICLDLLESIAIAIELYQQV